VVRRSLLITVLLVCALSAHGDSAQRYRAFWVETFNTPFATRLDVDRVLGAALRSNANALFVEVRRRGDAWYLDAKEPLPEVDNFGEPDATGRLTFDPLRYLIARAHTRGIEVHAFTIVGAVYNGDPRVKLPSDPQHAFLQHVWDAAAGEPYRGRRQWATRALPYNAAGTFEGGQRFGKDWYVDLGHPDAAAYTISALTYLVHKYELDGIHLDRIRYPESPLDRPRGEPWGSNVGYNETSVARFNARYGTTGWPKSNDPRWNDWRREQVTSFVRRLTLEAKSIRPAIKVSAAVVCFGAGPHGNGGFEATEPYARVFQDWQGWLEEGLLDLVLPMNYKREKLPAQSRQFDDWARFTIDTAHANGRQAVVGLGAYLNPLTATLRQARRVLSHGADGVAFFSLARPRAGAPATSDQARDDFANAVRSGLSAAGDRYEAASNEPLFAVPVRTPPPRDSGRGSMMGIALDPSGTPLDGAIVTVENLTTHQLRRVRTDGNGFYGLLGLVPGRYRALVLGRESCLVEVIAGRVVRADVPPPACVP
jgi:uncharacterized lipoprotein YddW (UPF0748 family)